MTIRFWKDGEKFTEREIDSYWNGREEEQDRIIKLLEHMPRTDDDRTVDAPTLIALIKGEK